MSRQEHGQRNENKERRVFISEQGLSISINDRVL